MFKQTLRQCLVFSSILGLLAMKGIQPGYSQESPVASTKAPVIHEVTPDLTHIEMTVNTSRILNMEGKMISQVLVDNENTLVPVALGPFDVMISAVDTGTTRLSVWDDEGQLYTITVVIKSDPSKLEADFEMGVENKRKMLEIDEKTTQIKADLLEEKLNTFFPGNQIKVWAVNNMVMVDGTVVDVADIEPIIAVAEAFFPRRTYEVGDMTFEEVSIINHLSVAGVQQILLHVKVLEVSRSKLRQLGFDWSAISSSVTSGAAGILQNVGSVPAASGVETLAFGIVSGGSEFLGFLEALRERQLMNVLSEPTIVAVSGRPANFIVGGQFGFVVDGGLNGPSVMWKDYGTRIDFVALALGNGRIRLEVRPEVSQRDDANAVDGVPAINSRSIDTGVELQAGQTLAIAGLVEDRWESRNRGFPWVSDVPYVGALFRRVENRSNEIELLVMVTPELVEAVDAEDMPVCQLGSRTTKPGDCDLYLKGHLEVPNCCPHGESGECGQCDQTSDSPGFDLPGGSVILEEREGGLSKAEAPREQSIERSRGSSVPLRPSLPESKPTQRTTAEVAAGVVTPTGLIGPIGYDIVK